MAKFKRNMLRQIFSPQRKRKNTSVEVINNINDLKITLKTTGSERISWQVTYGGDNRNKRSNIFRTLILETLM